MPDTGPRLGENIAAGGAGYLVIMLMLVVFMISIGLMVAAPLWETELQREKEEELIFRGKQYVEAVRIFAAKNPGRLPSTLLELQTKKCIRKLYKDPMTGNGEWDLILNAGAQGQTAGSGTPSQQVLVGPERALGSLQAPRILGVVSRSTKRSVMIYNDQESYDKWLFFYGQDPKKLPKIIRLDEKSQGP